MKKLAETYVKYGVPSDLAAKYEKLNLSASSFRNLPNTILKEKYKLRQNEIKIVKTYLIRQVIPQDTLQKLLENSNFTCCCCTGTKSDAYIVHHIVKYEISQDNSYENLAVLCPNDHDLAHRGTGLTNSLTSDQIKSAKDNWEQIVQLRKLVAASPAELKKFYLSIPRYQEIIDEIERLKSTIADKEDIAKLSISALRAEREVNESNITKLSEEKNTLELQIKTLINKLSQFQPDQYSEIHKIGVELFLSGDINGALGALSEKELNVQLEKIIDTQNSLLESVKGNIESRFLRANLLFINGNEAEACHFVGETLRVCENLCDSYTELLPKLASCFEIAGTIYFCCGHIDSAEAVFQKGLDLCDYLINNDIPSITPLIPDFLHNLGTVNYSRNRYVEAREFLESSLEWYKDLSSIFIGNEFPSNNFITSNLIRNYINLSVTYQAMNLEKEAKTAFEEAQKLKIESKIFEENSGCIDELQIRYLSSSANLSLKSGDASMAIKPLMELILILEDKSKENPKRFLRELVNTYLEICAASLQNNTEVELANYIELAIIKARSLLSLEVNGDPSPLAYAIMFKILNSLQNGSLSASDLEIFQEAFDIVEDLKPEEGDPKIREGINMLKGLIGQKK